MTMKKIRDYCKPSDTMLHAEPQRSQSANAFVCGVVMTLVTLCGSAWAVDITTDTSIGDANVADYASVPIAVAADATLTIELAPSSADQVFSGAVSGAGKIVVANTGAKAVFFSGSFMDFTGELSASGDVRIRNVWSDLKLNGSLSGVTVEGAAGNTVKFFGKDVFGANGAALNPGHQSGSYSTIDLNGFDQTISLLTFMGCAYAETSSSYKTPTYTLKSADPATLTVCDGFCWATTSGPHPNDHSGLVQVNDALSLVFNGSDSTSFTFHGTSTTTGGLTVKSGEIVLADDATFNNLSALTVAGTGRIVLETAAVNAANLALDIADNGMVTLPDGDVFRVKALKVGDVSVAPGDYTAEEIAKLTGNRLKGAAVEVLSREIGETKTFTWIGGGADDSLATAANWQGGVAPALTGGDEILVLTAGTSATIPTDADIYGIEITAASGFTLRGETFRLGAGGLTCGETEAARVCRFEAVPRTAGEQTWRIPTNTVVELAAGWAGRSAVTLERTTGTGDIVKFSSDEPPAFAGSLIVPGDTAGGNVLVLSGRGGIGTTGAHVQLNGKAGVRATAACVTNRAAITFSHGPALNIAPAGTEFVQLGAMTNLSSGAYSSALAVNGTLRVGGGLGESAAHQGNPKAYEWWTWQFNVAGTGALWIEGKPIAVGSCPFRVYGAFGGAGAVHLSAQRNAYGVFALSNGMKAFCEGVDTLSAAGDLGFCGENAGSLDLNGFDQTVRDVLVVGQTGFEDQSSGNSDMYVTSATPATLKLTGTGTYVPNNLNFRGEASLHYAGTGRLALTNTASSTVGSLTVSGGEVALLAGATWANCTNVVVSGSGKLTLDAGVAAKGAFSREATVSVSDDGTIAIPAGETVEVRYLYRDGEPTFRGSYSDGFVTGGGTLRVRKSSRKGGLLLLIK